jgi:hypothetical protein
MGATMVILHLYIYNVIPSHAMPSVVVVSADSAVLNGAA